MVIHGHPCHNRNPCVGKIDFHHGTWKMSPAKECQKEDGANSDSWMSRKKMGMRNCEYRDKPSRNLAEQYQIDTIKLV